MFTKILVILQPQTRDLRHELTDTFWEIWGPDYEYQVHRKMRLTEVADILNAEIICGQHIIDREVEAVFASDLMSDVLTIDSDKLLLLTGLVNIQTIRTSEMSDIQNIVLVRNKKATPEMIAMAEENGIVIMQCSYSMYKSCGMLFQNGLNPVY